MKWKEISGTAICAPLSVSGDFVISHRPGDFTASWRPPGRHVHLSSFPDEASAKKACEDWFASGCPVDADSTGFTEYATGFKRWWK